MGIYAQRILHGANRREAYQDFRKSYGSTVLLALDLLVAAEIILTVILDLSFETFVMLALLVLIRTFLHFVLELEMGDHSATAV